MLKLLKEDLTRNISVYFATVAKGFNSKHLITFARSWEKSFS